MDLLVQLLGFLGDLLAPPPFRSFETVFPTMLLIPVIATLNRGIVPLSIGASLTTPFTFVSA